MLIELWTPLREIVIGAMMLLVSLSIHFFGMLTVQAVYVHRVSKRRYLSAAQQAGLASLLLLMLLTHIVEIVAWGTVLNGLGAIARFADAIYYVSVTYTTLGYGEGTLPANWRLMSPLIAMSGLFAFGWTTGVMFRIVTQDAATGAAAPGKPRQ